jgi:hypothetical protein
MNGTLENALYLIACFNELKNFCAIMSFSEKRKPRET